ncbi:dynein regulatory complex subunit 2 [Chaetodon trifascialis]|uniref:dynein regulatory complex subunit 2 n=1 Tax=Chaetodon trifascialis TaxID=109706 RepID=UPI0039915AA7
MPKKAKKGGKGGAKTEEERLLYLQQRAQAEEEMAKRREEILTLFLKDKLQKEERNTAVNLLKLNEGWRSILRQTRAAELREDVTVLSQTFERRLDGLDSIVKNLERDLQEAERQSAQVRRVHLQHVERLWTQQHRRLTFVQQQWENGLQHLSSRFSCERKQMAADSQQQRADLEDATFTVEQKHKAAMDELHRLYSESIAAYRSAYDDRKAALSNQETLKEKTLRRQEAEQLCSKDTKELEQLLSTKQRFLQMTNEHMRKVERLQDTITQLRDKLNSTKTENQSVEQDLTAARNQVNRKTHKLRDQLTQAQTAARKQLTDLTVQSNNAAKKLQAVIAKGQRVLRVADMCRKLESEQKDDWLFPPEEHRPETTEPAQVAAEFPELLQVSWSLSAATLQREALRKHRDDLSRENQQLRLLLRRRLDAMTVSDDAFDGHQALLAVRPAPLATTPPDTSRHHTVIEAAHAAKHSL